MRRAIIAIAGTTAGLVAVLSYKSGAPPRRVVAGPAGSAGPSTTAPVGPASTGTSTTAPPTPTTAAAPAGDRTIEGQDVPNQYGDVQVRVVFKNGRISDVQPVVLPSDRPRSQEISDIAGPMLRQEVLDAQSANIDVISGATYTSESYAESVQSAIDQSRQRP